MAELELDSVTKVYDDPGGGAITAVDDISLAVEDGEFLVLLGPSGCGKTTTLRMIAGLEDVTEGQVLLDGIDITGMKPRHRNVAMVFQNFALYPHMTVEQNLGFGLKREDNDMSPEAIDRRIKEVATMLEIEDHLDSKPASLSGGQKQRVALGRAIIREPRLFLFDEPLANLDASLRKTMRTEIDALQQKTGITSVYVTHNQEEAMSIADKIAILDDGQLHQIGTPGQVFNEPVDLFVAQFVGSPPMNIFDGAIEQDADTCHVTVGDLAFDLPADLVASGEATRDVAVGIRPQDLFRSTVHGIDGPVMEADLEVIEPLGTEATLYGEASGTEVRATVTQFRDLTTGESVPLTVAPEHVYLFDRGTGQLLKGRLDAERADAELGAIQP